MNPREGDGDPLEPTDAVAVIGGSLVVARGHERQATISRAIERLGGDVLISGLFRSSIQDPMTTQPPLVHRPYRAIRTGEPDMTTTSTKTAVLVLSDPAVTGDESLGRVFNALAGAFDLDQAGKSSVSGCGNSLATTAELAGPSRL